VTSDLAAGLGLPRPGGALVGDVSADGPAARSGLRRGDVVVALDGQPVADSHALRGRIADRKPGTTARLSVLRDGQTREVSVVLGELPEQRADEGATGDSEGPHGYGLRLADINPAVAGQLGIDAKTAGVVIAEVEPNSPAAELDLRPGDIVKEIDGQPVDRAEAAALALRAHSAKPHVLVVLRAGRTFYVPLTRREG